MKPLKIRVWVKSLGRMITPKSINFDDDGNIASVSFVDPQVKEFPEENSISGMAFCQFTGFRGVNSAEIYDNDVVDDGEGNIGVIEQNEDGAWVVVFDDGTTPIEELLSDASLALSVIGNRFENPEVLEAHDE
jgi:uncharacterized phage protein (TIGR01671 family)